MARACNTSAPPAANQDAAITADTELSDNPRRGAAGTSSKAVALGALPRHAANGPVGFPIDTYRSYGPRPCDFRPVFQGETFGDRVSNCAHAGASAGLGPDQLSAFMGRCAN